MVHLPLTPSYPEMQLPLPPVSTEQDSPPLGLALHLPIGIACVASHAASASQSVNVSAAMSKPHAAPSLATPIFLHVLENGLQISPTLVSHCSPPEQSAPSASG